MLKPIICPELGVQLRAIREKLGLTLDALRKEVGISASYISDFERGVKLPTPKYLRHLHNKYNVSIDYVFGGSNKMFRPGKEDLLQADFGKFEAEVNELMIYMSKIPHCLYAMLLHFSEYKIDNKGMINRFMTD